MSAFNRSDRSRRVPSPTCFSGLAATLLPAAILTGERKGVEGRPTGSGDSRAVPASAA